MPTRIPIYRDEIFTRLDNDKQELLGKLDLIKSNIELLIKESNKKQIIKKNKVGD